MPEAPIGLLALALVLGCAPRHGTPPSRRWAAIRGAAEDPIERLGEIYLVIRGPIVPIELQQRIRSLPQHAADAARLGENTGRHSDSRTITPGPTQSLVQGEGIGALDRRRQRKEQEWHRLGQFAPWYRRPATGAAGACGFHRPDSTSIQR